MTGAPLPVPLPAPARARHAAAVLALVWLVLGLCCLADFGPTWDSLELRVGDQLLGFALDPAAAHWDPTRAAAYVHRPPAPAIVPVAVFAQSAVVSTAMAAGSCWLLWDVLGWLPAMSGYLAATVLLVAVLVFVCVRFGERCLGAGAGLFAAALLLLSPRFATEAISNFKDAPECVFFSLAAVAAFAALQGGTTRGWLWFGAATGLACAQKPNGAFLPLLPLPFLVACWCRRGGGFRAPRWYALPAAAVAAVAVLVALLPHVWPDPVGRLHERIATLAALGNARLGGADAALPATASFASLGLALATTPIGVLVAAVAGACMRPRVAGARAFVLVWLLVPLLRTLLPGMRHFDGVRHYLEFMVPLALLAGLGIAGAVQRLRGRGLSWLAVIAGVVPVADCALALASVYPYGTCYFSPLVGGLRGAQQRALPDATDYWCASYWQAADWLVQHADPGASVVCVVADHLFTAIKPVRWRSDLQLCGPGQEANALPLYAVYTTRREYHPRWLVETRARTAPVHTIEVQGGVILEVLRLPDEQALAALRTHQRATALGLQLAAELAPRGQQALAELWQIVNGADRRGEAGSLELLRALLPARGDDELRLVLWPYQRPR